MIRLGKPILIMTIALMILLIIVLISLHNSQVKIVFQYEKNIEPQDITRPYWFLVTEENNVKASQLGIDLDTIDFRENNVIVSIGSEINHINFRGKKGIPFLKSHFVTVYFSNKFTKDVAYIYLIDKLEVYQDIRDMNSIIIE